MKYGDRMISNDNETMRRRTADNDELFFLKNGGCECD